MKATLPSLAKLKPPRKWIRPLCIMVDEIRTIGERHADSIRELHEGRHGLPIVLVCAGLADSGEALVKNGASRMQIANVHTLGALKPDECASYVEQMLGRCGIKDPEEESNSIAKRIAERSEGWPQHLHTETAALFWGLGKAGCDLGKVDFKAVEDQAAAYGKRSYQARRSMEMWKAEDLIAAVMVAVPEDGMKAGGVQHVIERTARTDDSPWRLPKGMDADMLLDHLIHQGALQPNEEDKLSCPIPSFRTWLINQGPNARWLIKDQAALRGTDAKEKVER